MKSDSRKIVIVNQASNYLTIGICNEFSKSVKEVALVTGSIHVQGEPLNVNVKTRKITRWKEKHGVKKAIIYIKALCEIYYLLLTRYRKHEVFFISAPPMGYLLNLCLRNRFSMLIWDVFPDTFKITGMKNSHFVYRTWANLNTLSFKKAYSIFTIGEKIADLLSQYVPKNKIKVQPIWSIFQDNMRIHKADNVFVKKHGLENKFIVQYSGNIGLTHKVELMVTLAEKMRYEPNILFQIIGRGPRKSILEKLVIQKDLKNCQFLPFQSDEMFPSSLSSANLGVVILDSITSKGSVPSKSYNLMSYGIPSLYIASKESELQSYVDKYQHAKCFEENDLDSAVIFIKNLYRSPDIQDQLSKNALYASQDFKRTNATKLVQTYLSI